MLSPLSGMSGGSYLSSFGDPAITPGGELIGSLSGTPTQIHGTDPTAYARSALEFWGILPTQNPNAIPPAAPPASSDHPFAPGSQNDPFRVAPLQWGKLLPSGSSVVAVLVGLVVVAIGVWLVANPAKA
jgi:hypothetical protein